MPIFFFFFFLEDLTSLVQFSPITGLLEELGFSFLNRASGKGRRGCCLLLLSVWSQFSYLSSVCFTDFQAPSHLGHAYHSISVQLQHSNCI